MENNYSYWKYEEDGSRKYCPMNDYDGSITGKIVMNVRAWFDENPEERKRLGWIKQIHKSTKDIKYNKQTQYLKQVTRQIDEYTIQDDYYVMDKSEEQMLLEELLEGTDLGVGGFTFIGNGNDGGGIVL